MVRKAVPFALVLLALFIPAGGRAMEAQGEPYLLAVLNDFNGVLRAEWMDLRVQVEQLELLTVGSQRSGARLHRQPSHWVPGDFRRAADGNRLTYLVDTAEGTGNLDPAEAEAAIDRATAAWSSDSCLKKAPAVKRAGDGPDPDLFDAHFGYGGIGDFRAADIVHAAWLPPDFFTAVTGPGGESVVALSVTFIFVDQDGVPTDLDGNGYLDTAANEIYYNMAFFEPDGLDLETVALHELGHSLGLTHRDERPGAVMYPVYSGVRRSLDSIDHAALCSVWASWPKK